MSNSNSFKIISMLLCVIVLSACQGKNRDAKKDVMRFVQGIEAASKKSELSKVKKPVEIENITYNGSDLRDPFSMPAQSKSVKRYPNTILSDTSLDALKLTGVIFYKDDRWAILRAGNGGLYKVTEGMRVGLQSALLTQISKDSVKFSIDSDNADEKKHDVVMTIQESAR